MAITLLLRVAGSFLNDTSTVESMDATSQGPVSSETVLLKVRYNRRYPVKWNTPAAAEGCLGHAEKLLELGIKGAFADHNLIQPIQISHLPDYLRGELSDPAHGTQRLQPRRPRRVCCNCSG